MLILFSCMKDGEVVSPLSEKEKNDKRVCVALFLYCEDQFNQCTNNPETKSTCARPYQDCNNIVRGCVYN